MFTTVVASTRTERRTGRHMRGLVIVRDKMVQSDCSALHGLVRQNKNSFQRAAARRELHIDVPMRFGAQRRHQFKFVPVHPGKASTGQLSASRFPAARGLCGNGRKAKTGGMYG
jgi:hypothetical protein